MYGAITFYEYTSPFPNIFFSLHKVYFLHRNGTPVTKRAPLSMSTDFVIWPKELYRIPSKCVRYTLLLLNCPSARCASAANAVCSDDHVFVSRNFLLRRLLQDSWLYIIIIIIIIITCLFFSFSFVCIQYYYHYCYYCYYLYLYYLYLRCAVSVIGLVAVDSAHK
jgi:hypothetical protein